MTPALQRFNRVTRCPLVRVCEVETGRVGPCPRMGHGFLQVHPPESTLLITNLLPTVIAATCFLISSVLKPSDLLTGPVRGKHDHRLHYTVMRRSRVEKGTLCHDELLSRLSTTYSIQRQSLTTSSSFLAVVLVKLSHATGSSSICACSDWQR
jgi:hypothetical protein